MRKQKVPFKKEQTNEIAFVTQVFKREKQLGCMPEPKLMNIIENGEEDHWRFFYTNITEIEVVGFTRSPYSILAYQILFLLLKSPV